MHITYYILQLHMNFTYVHIDSEIKTTRIIVMEVDKKNAKKVTHICGLFFIYVTGETDPSGESVPPGLNLPGGMEPGMNTNI